MNVSRNLLRLLGRSAGPPAARCEALLGPPGPPAVPGCVQVRRSFHGSAARSKTPADFIQYDRKQKDKSLVVHDDLFEQVAREVKTKATFNKVIDVFVRKDVRRRGHVEFIYAALKKMAEFGVERDLDVYNKLLDVFPKEVFVPRNFIQRMFNHYPRQQECGVQVLEQMENYGILPSVETKVLLVQIFGEKSHPIRKYQRILYWFPRFKHVNPFPVPLQLPQDPVDLARFGLTRISNDRDAKVTVYQLPRTESLEGGAELTLPHIVGIQSPNQMELLSKHDVQRPVLVEGPFPLWLRSTCLHYYVLRAEPVPTELQVEEPFDPERCFDYPLQLDLELDRDIAEEESFDVDDLDEGPVFAMCMTSQGDQASLNQWISGLQQQNPVLGRVPTLFRLQAGSRELQTQSDRDQDQDQDQEPLETQREPEVLMEEEEEPRRSRGMKQ